MTYLEISNYSKQSIMIAGKAIRSNYCSLIEKHKINPREMKQLQSLEKNKIISMREKELEEFVMPKWVEDNAEIQAATKISLEKINKTKKAKKKKE